MSAVLARQKPMQELEYARTYIEEGYRFLTNGRPGRGQLFEFLQFIIAGVRIGRHWFHTDYIAAETDITRYNQCRYRWKLARLGAVQIQRVRKGAWAYLPNYQRLYELAVIGGFKGAFELFMEVLRINKDAPQKKTYAPLIERATDKLLEIFPYTEGLTHEQARNALRWAAAQYGEQALEGILGAAVAVRNKETKIRPRSVNDLIYRKMWRLIGRVLPQALWDET